MRRIALALCSAAFVVSACADEAPLDPSPEADMHAGPASLEVTLRDPWGGPVCDSLPNSALLEVGVFDQNSGGGFTSVEATCPDGVAVLGLSADTEYELFVESRDVPWAAFTLSPDTIRFGADSAMTLRMHRGRLLGGNATLNGAPWQAGELMQVSRTGRFFSSHGLSPAATDLSGAWTDDAGRRLRLQHGVYYRECQPGLGMRLGSGPDTIFPAHFPTEFTRIDCRFRTSCRERFTHYATDLQLTPEAGRIDPWEGDKANGLGFGVAHPTGGDLDYKNNVLDEGALMWLVDSLDNVVTPQNLGRLVDCQDTDPAVCPYFQPVRGPIVALDGGARRVRWEMNDTGAVAGDFRVVQMSWDGAYGDYVLYKLTFHNEGATATDTIHPAWYMNWDLFRDSDYAGSALGGRLAWVNDGSTRWFGTYNMGVPVAVWVAECCGIGDETTSAAAILRGEATSGGAFSTNVTATVGTRLVIPPGESRSWWFAVVAGSSFLELEFTAGQARNEMLERRSGTFGD